MDNFLDIAPEVASAIARGEPVVALESTLIAHGLPYPRNLDTAAAMMGAVRDEGATPAVIGIMNGRIRVGLGQSELEKLARGGGSVLKVSRRDLAFALSQGRDGGTTVAATMICARLAGLRIFATGGIGGVHRGAVDTMDISADLEELARSPVAVVCAGAKAILDLPRTLEYLETKGVPVVGFRTDEFPGFYMRDSGLAAPHRLESPEAVAGLMAAHWSLGLSGGLVIANPPPEHVAMRPGDVEAAIAEALTAAAAQGVGGAALTPFLLDQMAEITGGRSLEANAALIESNARLAARIARAHAALPAPSIDPSR